MKKKNNLLDELDAELGEGKAGKLPGLLDDMVLAMEAQSMKEGKTKVGDIIGNFRVIDVQPSGPRKDVIEVNSITDLFGQPLPAAPEPISAATRPLIGADIIKIRQLTGKRRDEAIKALYEQTEAMMNAADAGCFFIPGNVASSKNSKEIGRYLKGNPKTGKLDQIPTLVDSKVTKQYKKNTAGYWLQNKVAFLNATRHMELPISVEFTFIRDSLRGYDAINAAQVICDLMSTKHGYGWIPDDETVYLHPVFTKQTFYHNRLCGVLIKVLK